jgi:adenylosuccinate synthase
MSVTVVLGAQWGDEGKGKLADILAHESQICCRAQGGNNAGHTIVANGVTYDFHILPSGLVNPNCINVIGSGCVVHVPSFFKELEALEKHGLNTEGRIYISDRAHVVFDVHQQVDGLEEVELGQGFIGTDTVLSSLAGRGSQVLTGYRHYQKGHRPNLQHQDDQEWAAHVRSL